MTKKPRTPRTAAFKKKVALEALREDKTLSQLATEYGAHPLLIGRWKKELIDGTESLFERKKSRKQDDEFDQEVLEKKIGRLTVEIDFLKKKLGYIPNVVRNLAARPLGKLPGSCERQTPGL